MKYEDILLVYEIGPETVINLAAVRVQYCQTQRTSKTLENQLNKNSRNSKSLLQLIGLQSLKELNRFSGKDNYPEGLPRGVVKLTPWGKPILELALKGGPT